MFTILFRKMRNTKWMVLCLFIGFLMAAGMMSTVPIYMDASLQRVLIKEMEQYQLQSGIYPGRYIVSAELPLGVSKDDQHSILDQTPKMVSGRVNRIGIPVLNNKTVVSDNLLYLVHGDSSTRIHISAMSDIDQHITVKQGELFSGTGMEEDGSYQIILTEDAARTLGVVSGAKYLINPVDTNQDSFYVTVKGIFIQSDMNDSYWSEDLLNYISSAFVSYEVYDKLIESGLVNVVDISVNYNFDYHSVDMNAIDSISGSIQDDFSYYSQMGYSLEMGSSDILAGYVEKASSLTAILWAIQIPTMVMLAFYLFMVSQLNIERERNEIAVLKSRGSSSKQIFALYSMEAGLLGVITFLLAPFIGLILCRFLGVSDGFMEFVNRTGIAAKLSLTAFLYALAAVAVFFVTTMLPIIPASKLTIVQYKQSKVKVRKTALWELCGIDIILIGLSIAFYFLYTHFTNLAIEEGTFVATGQIDPLIFVFSTCLILGLGLLFVRVYPYLLKLVYLIGKLLWTPSQYMAISTVSCAGGSKERFLMLFLILTFAYGLFSANTARAINNNKSDMIYYQNGADVTLMEYWIEQEYTIGGSTMVTYQEKDFSRFEELAGIESATKVLVDNEAKISSVTQSRSVSSRNVGNNEEVNYKNSEGDFDRNGENGDNNGFNRDNEDQPNYNNNYNNNKNNESKATGSSSSLNVKAMAIEPIRFAQTAWFRDDLLPVHWYNYCNALNEYTNGALISSSVADLYNLKLGDSINVRFKGQSDIPVTVLSIIDYWPGINPNGTPEYFCVVNYNYILSNSNVMPYQVWLKLSDDATSEELYADITQKRIPIETINDSSQMMIEEKNSPTLQGMNGGLTLGFIITMIMAIIGFLIYWILSIKGRTLQFGILRAMGMTMREIIGMLGYEQILVSLVSIAMAFIIGGITSDIFVPLFQNMYSVEDQIPPFIISAAASDYIKIYILIVVMLGGGFAILGSIIRKININKALKLGED